MLTLCVRRKEVNWLRNNQKNKKAFTIVELLTVMSVIIILIGVIVPSLNQVRKFAKKVNQNAQFHSIKVAIEFFNSEYEDYPPSDAEPSWDATQNVCTGAHLLAEALVGRDYQGFDPISTWNAAEDAQYNQKAYALTGIDTDIELSQQRRMGPYLDVEGVGIFGLDELYDGSTGRCHPGDPNSQYGPAPVLTDVYETKTVTVGDKNVRVGSPILYYKADTTKKELNPTNATAATNSGPSLSIYDIRDNDAIVDLGPIQGGGKHWIEIGYTNPLGELGEETFYDQIENPQIPWDEAAQEYKVRKPYNKDTYILVSAGYDGIFGTKDDIFNFGD